MFFDDRLATVLRQRATGEAGLRTQFRQLLDLLGKDQVSARGAGDHSLIAAAWLRLDALAEAVPAAERARMIREPGWRFRNPGLAVHLAEYEPEVASAALNRAELSSEDWAMLIPRLPVRARGFLRLRRDLPLDVEALLERLGVHDRGLPAPETATAKTSASALSDTETAPTTLPSRKPRPIAAPAALRVVIPASLRERDRERERKRKREDTGRTEISALVERIAEFRRERGEEPRQDLERSPRLPLGEMPERTGRTANSFGFAADAAGRVDWASSDVAPMVIGIRLFTLNNLGDEIASEAGLERAFSRRQPITRSAITLAGAPAIAGNWIVDAEPRFSEGGHFTGYFGRCRRVPDRGITPLRPEAREADRIRQLLHELRTPITAVQGYAEVIQQQLFGPAPHEYRALAAAIAADAARILSGFDELDRLARLETGAATIEPGETDLAAMVRGTALQLAPVLRPFGAQLALEFSPDTAMLIAIDADDAEALVWRVLASVSAVCGAGERISVSIDPVIGPDGAMARLACTLPAGLAMEANLFAATTRAADSAINAGLFGAGFALRLARAEARAAGGAMRRDGDNLVLTLPLLTDYPALPSALCRDAGAALA